MNACEVDGDCTDRLGANDEIHAIRCCSDTDIPHFMKKTDNCWGTSYYNQPEWTQVTTEMDPGYTSGSPDSTIQEGCMRGTWSEANDQCAAWGGRLCTRDELADGCTAGTGCWFDLHLVWTSETDVNYWAVGPIASTDVSDDSCGSDGILARPKTHAEQQVVEHILPKLPSGGAHSGSYYWLGGKFDLSSSSWKWNDGSPVGLPGTGETNWDDGEGQIGNGAGEPYLGLKRASGRWHDFHGQNVEINPGQIALCEGFTKYWVVGPIASTELSVNPCGSHGVLAMPKTHAEQDMVEQILPSLPSGGAHSGNYVWLGGYWDGDSWKWNDDTPVGLPDTGETNWDTNQGQPGHGPTEPHLGLKRSNGRWHDFHGQNVEINPGMIALCQAS